MQEIPFRLDWIAGFGEFGGHDHATRAKSDGDQRHQFSPPFPRRALRVAQSRERGRIPQSDPAE